MPIPHLPTPSRPGWIPATWHFQNMNFRRIYWLSSESQWLIVIENKLIGIRRPSSKGICIETWKIAIGTPSNLKGCKMLHLFHTSTFEGFEGDEDFRFSWTSRSISMGEGLDYPSRKIHQNNYNPNWEMFLWIKPPPLNEIQSMIKLNISPEEIEISQWNFH